MLFVQWINNADMSEMSIPEISECRELYMHGSDMAMICLCVSLVVYVQFVCVVLILG